MEKEQQIKAALQSIEAIYDELYDLSLAMDELKGEPFRESNRKLKEALCPILEAIKVIFKNQIEEVLDGTDA